MFEKIIEKIIIQYFGDYIENLDLDKLNLGLLSGNLTLEEIKLKEKKINEYNLPFKLISGILKKLIIKFPWTNNFNTNTIIEIENLQLILSIIEQKDWNFKNNFNDIENKLMLLKNFFNKYIEDITEKIKNKIKENNNINNKNNNYLDKIKNKIIDNIKIGFKNIHIRIEDNNNKFSLGLMIDEILLSNTDKNFQEKFFLREQINNNNNNNNKLNLENIVIIEDDMNKYKILKITNLSMYINYNEKIFISNYSNNQYENIMNEIYNNNENIIIFPINLFIKLNIFNNNKINKYNIDIEITSLKLIFKKSQYDIIIKFVK